MDASAPTTMCDSSVHQVLLVKQQVNHGTSFHAMNVIVKKKRNGSVHVKVFFLNDVLH